MSTAALRKQARMLMWLVTIPLAGLVIVALATAGNVAYHGGSYAQAALIWYFPMLLYIWAIWMVRVALQAIAGGAMFDTILPRLLARIGFALFGGAVYNVFAMPLLGYARTFEASAVTLGIIGAMLVLLARLHERAGVMRDELDGFF